MVKINKGSYTPTTVGIYKLQKWNRGLNSKNMTLKTPPVKQIYAKFVFFGHTKITELAMSRIWLTPRALPERFLRFGTWKNQ